MIILQAHGRQLPSVLLSVIRQDSYAKRSSQLYLCAGIQQHQTCLFRCQARGSDKRGIALAISLKIEVRPCLDKYFNWRKSL